MRYSLNVCVSFGRVVAATVLLLLVSASAERSCLCEDGGRNVSLCTTDFVVCAGGEPVTGLEDWFLTIPLVVSTTVTTGGTSRLDLSGAVTFSLLSANGVATGNFYDAVEDPAGSGIFFLVTIK